MVAGVILALLVAVTGCAIGPGLGQRTLLSETTVWSVDAEPAVTTTVEATLFAYDDSVDARVETRVSLAFGVIRRAGVPANPTAVPRLSNRHPEESERLLVAQFATNSADDLVDLASPARCSHILDGEVRPNGSYGGGHRGGTGFPGKSEFPTSWSDNQVMHHISDVVTDPASQIVRTQGRDVFVRGTRDGIDIEVLIRNGEIWTGYPTNVPRNP